MEVCRFNASQRKRVTMNSISDVINEGHVLVQNGKITAVWGGDNIPQNVDQQVFR